MSPNRLMICLTALVVAWMAVAQTVQAAEDKIFDTQAIPFNDKILGVFCSDLNGAGGKELVVFTQEPAGTRRLSVFEAGLERALSTSSTTDLALPTTAFAYQVIDFDRDGREEVLLLGLDGIFLLEFESGAYSREFRTVASYERLFSMPDPTQMMPLEFSFDLDDDGIFEFLLPCWRGVGLFRNQGGSYVRTHQFEVPQRAAARRKTDFLASNSPSFSFHLPFVLVHDLNTDRSKDVFVETNAGLSIYYQTGNMQFADQPSKRLEVRSSYLEGLYFASSGFGDLNNDGLIDYCRVFTQGDGYDAKSAIEVFLGNINDGYAQRPSKRIVLEEFIVGLSLIDLDHDGAASLIVATQDLSTISMVKSLMVKRIPVELKIFGTASGVMSETPIAVKKASCAVELLLNDFPARFIGCLSADLDTDLRNELVIVNHDDELQVFSGENGVVFSDKPSFSSEMDNVYRINSAYFDQDEKCDLIVEGADEDGRENIIILWSK